MGLLRVGLRALLRRVGRFGFAGYRVTVPIQVDPDTMRRSLMHQARVHADTAQLLHSLMAGEWDRVDAASAGSSAAASGLIAAYAQWHLERGIRSLSHVSFAPGGAQ